MNLIYPGNPYKKDDFESMVGSLMCLSEGERKRIKLHLTGASLASYKASAPGCEDIIDKYIEQGVIMYKPIAEDNSNMICALMRLYKIYYRIIGLIVLIAGLIIMPFVPKLISGTVPDGINIYVLYVLNLAATVVSYWLFAYKNSLLTAHQRTDIVNNITIATSTVQYVLQAVVLLVMKNYYVYLIVALASQAVLNRTLCTGTNSANSAPSVR